MKTGSALILFGLLLILGAGLYIIFENYPPFRLPGSFRMPETDQEAGYNKFDKLEKENKILLQKGRILLEDGSPKSLRKAIEYFSRVVVQSLKYKDKARFYIGVAYERLGLPETAVRKYLELSGRDTNLPEDLQTLLAFKIAKLQIMTLYKDEAYVRLLDLLKRTHSPALRSEIYTELGKLHSLRDEKKKAEESFRIAVQEDPTNREASLLLAKLLQRSGDYYGAFGIYENYLRDAGNYKENKKQVLTRYREDALKIGLDFYKAKKYNKAIEYLKHAARRFKHTFQEEIALFHIANSYAMLKKTREAINCYERVLSNSSTARDQISLLKIGQLYFDLGRYKQALHYFVALQKNYPDSKYRKIALDWEEESRKSLHAYNYYVRGAKGSRPE